MNDSFARFFVSQPSAWDPLGYAIHFGYKDSTGAIVKADTVTMRRAEPDDPTIHPPMLSGLNEASLQTLMDGLWNAGIRPSDIGTPGHLAATKEHLNDFRKLVEKAYDIKL